MRCVLLRMDQGFAKSQGLWASTDGDWVWEQINRPSLGQGSQGWSSSLGWGTRCRGQAATTGCSWLYGLSVGNSQCFLVKVWSSCWQTTMRGSAIETESWYYVVTESDLIEATASDFALLIVSLHCNVLGLVLLWRPALSKGLPYYILSVISCAYSITANLNSSHFLKPRYFVVVSFRPLMRKLLTDTVPWSGMVVSWYSLWCDKTDLPLRNGDMWVGLRIWRHPSIPRISHSHSLLLSFRPYCFAGGTVRHSDTK